MASWRLGRAPGPGMRAGLGADSERSAPRGGGFNARKWRAAGSGARGELMTAVEQERDIATLHGGGDGFGAVEQRAFVGRFKAKEQGGDLARLQGRAEVAQEGRRVAE